MKKYLGVLGVVVLTQISSIYAQDAKRPIQEDKVLHFGAAATAQTGCFAVAEAVTSSKWGSQVGCWLAINSLGVAKELTDPGRGGTRDVNDIYANMAGSGFSFLMLSATF